jgi:hypothetical protein
MDYVQMRLENATPVAYNFTARWAPVPPEFQQREFFFAEIQ